MTGGLRIGRTKLGTRPSLAPGGPGTGRLVDTPDKGGLKVPAGRGFLPLPCRFGGDEVWGYRTSGSKEE